VTLPAGASDPRRVGGGDINEAFRVRLRDGREAFVKTRADARPGEYEAEARGLSWLGEARALAVPEVLEVGERYLALEWIEPGHLDAAGEEQLGRGLARLHAAGAPHFGAPPAAATEGAGEEGAAGERAGAGRERPSARFGSLALPNDPLDEWPRFYAERRLDPLRRMAAERGAISAAAASALARVCERLGDLCGPPEPPARLHGDLWWGNVLADAGGRPWLIDPSAYGGHREVDLAMLRLFGGGRERVYDAYVEAHPLADGWDERVALWQLAPLLVHAVLFGGSYGAAVERTARHYAG
jgi:fructosamine-3-kinase